MIYIGIDPGLDGAIAFFDLDKGHLSMIDMPTVEIIRNGKKKRELNAQLVANVFRCVGGDMTAVLERVNAMPGQGVSSVFSFGRSSGIVEGVLAGMQIPLTIVTPQAWQKAASVRGGKDGARQRATELFPVYAGLFGRKKDDGRADAACMAWYAATR
jgi:crossover junction endodeoxyribonuclease RuvC